MSDKAEKKPEAAPAAEKKDGHAKGGGGLMTKTPVLLAGVMLVEAVVLFVGFKFVAGGPKPANAADLTTLAAAEKAGPGDATTDSNEPVEVEVLEIKAPNRQNGRTFIYDLDVVISIKPQFLQKVTDALKARQALIEDRVRTIIGEADPDKLGGGSEPGLETLRRQVKYQLDEVLGDGIIDEVLIPRCIPYRADE
jgi:flagellar basal body-associated protein FliL